MVSFDELTSVTFAEGFTVRSFFKEIETLPPVPDCVTAS
jgi:hypothetical protein